MTIRQRRATSAATRRGSRDRTAPVESLLVYERAYWQQGVEHIAGIDEVGAGPLAGPVVAAAVIMPPWPQHPLIAGINDSKKLTAAARQRLAALIREQAVALAFGSCSVEEIDALNILQATRQAMRRAVRALRVQPDHLLVDARHIPGVTMSQTAIIKGDSTSYSIAAASIVAKVERDALMVRLAQQYPGYGLEAHKGYGTKRHLAALKRLGATPIHRRSFAPVTAVLGG